MTASIIHLVVEEGPDHGLEIMVPPDGIRIGRSSNNDVVLKDPVMSRFHCRIFFKPKDGLWAEDLGSANMMLINHAPLHESRLHTGDRVTIGETVLRVVSDQPPATQSSPGVSVDATPAAPPAHPLFGPPASAAPSGGDVTGDSGGSLLTAGRRRLLLILLLLAALAAVYGLSSGAKRRGGALATSAPAVEATAAGKPVLTISYEKVQAGTNNIFRYALDLKNNTLSIQIDDLQSGRHVLGNQRRKLEPDIVQSLIDTITTSDFFELSPQHKGLATEVWDQLDLRISIGHKAQRVRVLNTLEPDGFKKLREALEEFGQNELGLAALALPPEKLIEMGRAAHLRGRTLFDQREVKNENLYQAIRAFKESEWYLETIQPKPDFFTETVGMRVDCERLQKELYEKNLFLADRAIRLKDWQDAASQLRTICERIPDRSDERYTATQKKLIDVERHLKKK